MHIAIALNDCIRNISAVKKELPTSITDQEWLDHQSLIAPHFQAENKINRWYDQGHDIHIIAKKDKYNLKWLKDHYIPYNSIIEKEIIINPEIWIDSSLYQCFNLCPDIKQTILINENLSEKKIEQKCKNLHLMYPLPKKIKFTTWIEVEIDD